MACWLLPTLQARHTASVESRVGLLIALQVDVVTDSPIDVIKTNQIPFIQSLADALGVSTKQVYWYNLTESDLNTVSRSSGSSNAACMLGECQRDMQCSTKPRLLQAPCRNCQIVAASYCSVSQQRWVQLEVHFCCHNTV
jgi:hypothetical protein